MTDWLGDYQTLRERCGLVHLEAWSCIELRGEDRVDLLHNLCTNDIRRLNVGQGCEALLTNIKAKILAQVLVLNCPDRLLLVSPCDRAASIVAQIDRYVIREDVTPRERSDLRVDLLAGASSQSVVARAGFAARFSTHGGSVFEISADQDLVLAGIDWFGSGCVLFVSLRASFGEAETRLHAAGAESSSLEAIEAIRIERGTPYYGMDFDDSNLPQEINRSDRTISFTKGCYLGQETVARIDAMGHVNRLLCGVRLEGDELPVPGAELLADGKVVGRTSSATFSPSLQAGLALAMVRREHSDPGTRLASATGPAEVIPLPV